MGMKMTKVTPGALDRLRAVPVFCFEPQAKADLVAAFEAEQRARDERDAKIAQNLRLLGHAIDSAYTQETIDALIEGALALLDAENGGVK